MATPSSPLQLTATHVHVVRIENNVARLKIGEEYWDVCILQIKVDAAGNSSSDKLTMTQDVATIVQRHFQQLAAAGIFDPKAHSKVTLKGNRSLAATPTPGAPTHDIKFHHTLSLEDPSGTSRDVNLATNTVAISTLASFGNSLAAEDQAMHTPPGTPTPPAANPSAPPAPPSGGPAATPPPTPTSTASVVKRSVTTDPVTRQFATRGVTATKDPAETIQGKFYTSSSTKSVKGHLADFISNKANGFEEDPEFSLVFDDLKHVFANDPDGLQKAAGDFKGGWGSYGKFADGELSSLFDKTGGRTSGSITDKKQRILLVQLYAQYLKNGGTKMGENFYRIYSESSKKSSFPRRAFFQVAILEENNGKMKITSYPSGESLRPANCLFLKKTTDPTGNVTIAPYNEKHTGLDDLTTLQDLTGKTVDETVHHDVGGSGRCADRSLAHQLLMKGKAAGATAPTQAEIDAKALDLRTRASAYIKSPAFINSTTGAANPNVARLLRSLSEAIKDNAITQQKWKDQYAALLATIRAGGDPEIVKQAINKLDDSPEGIKETLKLKIYHVSTDEPARSTDSNYGQTIINIDPAGHLVQEALEAVIADMDREVETLQATCSQEANDVLKGSVERLQAMYGDLILQRDFQLDEAFFAALSEITEAPTAAAAAASAPANHKIVVIQDNTSAAGATTNPYTVTAVYPELKAGGKLNNDYLFIWYDSVGHYHTMDRDSETLRELIAGYTA